MSVKRLGMPAQARENCQVHLSMVAGQVKQRHVHGVVVQAEHTAKSKSPIAAERPRAKLPGGSGQLTTYSRACQRARRPTLCPSPPGQLQRVVRRRPDLVPWLVRTRITRGAWITMRRLPLADLYASLTLRISLS